VAWIILIRCFVERRVAGSTTSDGYHDHYNKVLVEGTTGQGWGRRPISSQESLVPDSKMT